MGTAPSRAEHHVPQPGNITEMCRRGRLKKLACAHSMLGQCVFMSDECNSVMLLYVLLTQHILSHCYFVVTYPEKLLMLRISYFMTVSF
jgi:hypothetical protein